MHGGRRRRASSRLNYRRNQAARGPRADASQARHSSDARYTETDAPSHNRIARKTARRSGGVVSTTYAAAAPAAATATFATVRADVGVTARV